uniref:Toll-like receptor 6 n=1 Tax=Diabrotica virgifera virgifera TaxID=50390 RepID=A0A6P7FBS7_DIAVI
MWLTITVVIGSIVACRGVYNFAYSLEELYSNCERTGRKNETIVCYNMTDIISWSGLHPFAFKAASNLDIVGTVEGVRARLHPVSYNEMSNFIRIRIRKINLDSLGPRSFHRLNNLEKIHLIDTGIRVIENNAFSSLPKLEQVLFIGNKITFFKYEIFFGCPMLKLLDFSNNQINETTDMVFDILGTLSFIRHINLSNNRINTSFKKVSNIYPDYDRIRSLWYAHNKFTELRVGWFRLRKKLEIINFAYNEIEYIEENTFNNNPNLHTIILSYNKLITIPITMIPSNFYPNLKYLAMDHNLIMGLDTSKQGPFRLLTNLKKITLAGNPFYCSCLNEVLNQMKHLNIQQVCSEEEH